MAEQSIRRFEHTACPVSTVGHDEGSRRDGRCTWCGARFMKAAQRPRPLYGTTDQLDNAYRYVYDPDWGNEVDPLDWRLTPLWRTR